MELIHRKAPRPIPEKKWVVKHRLEDKPIHLYQKEDTLGRDAPTLITAPDSSNAPSEPSIDYSSWSPRSYQSELCPLHNRNPKHKATQYLLLTSPPPKQQDPPFFSGRSSEKTRRHKSPTLATEDPATLRNLCLIHFLTKIQPLPIPSPVYINAFRFLNGNASDNPTWPVPQKNPPTDRFFSMPIVHPQPKEREAPTLPLVKVHRNSTEMLIYAHSKNCSNSDLGPLRQGPLSELTPFTLQTETALSSQAQQLMLPILTIHKQLSDDRASPLLPSGRASPLLSFITDSLSDPQLMDPTHALRHTFHSSPEDMSQMPAVSNSLAMAAHPTSNKAPDFFSDTQISAQPLTLAAYHPLSAQQETQGVQENKETKKRLELRPTRRSQRIQEKNKMNSDAPKNQGKNKAKSKMPAIPFDTTSVLTPLDSSKTLAILQATGLEITRHVEEMIEEALKQDLTHENTTIPLPTTPLHDPVPPMTVPQFDLPL